MSTVDAGCRVALLARPGAARDCVRGALLEVGAQVVAEEDPVSADPETVRAALPQVLMIVLDASAEDALGRFDIVIGDPSIEVMFEEADVAVAREGWEAARWRRHLAAKLRQRDGVLPPVSAVAEDVPGLDTLSMQIEELIAVDASDGEHTPVLQLPEQSTAGDDFSIFDPVAAEGGDGADDFVLTVDGLELDTSAFDPVDDAAPPAGDGREFSASDFGPLLAELDAEMPEPAPLAASVHDGLDMAFDVARDPDTAPAQPEGQAQGFGELSLADDDSVSTATTRGGAFAHNLDDLDRRIASLQLVDDDANSGAASPEPRVETVSGAVLVMAGLGGPDAVRQFLGALPAGFPRPVLVRQRLDGARYDKLVAQMQRATQLQVALAEAGRTLSAGTVYVVGDDIGIDATGGLHFVAGAADRIVETLPVGQSAVVMLSGGDVDDAARVAGLADQGLWMGAQTADGCYDPAAADALAAHGAVTAPPAELAHQLAQRWSS